MFLQLNLEEDIIPIIGLSQPPTWNLGQILHMTVTFEYRNGGKSFNLSDKNSHKSTPTIVLWKVDEKIELLQKNDGLNNFLNKQKKNFDNFLFPFRDAGPFSSSFQVSS